MVDEFVHTRHQPRQPPHQATSAPAQPQSQQTPPQQFSHHSPVQKVSRERSLWDKIWKDATDSVVIVQMPNVWIILWVIFDAISLFVSSARVAEVTSWIASASLAVWALLEIFKGANYFRRALGIVILVFVIMTVV